MRPPYAAPPPSSGDPEEDLATLGAWLDSCDRLYPSASAHSVPSRAGTTVALLNLGAAGEFEPDVVLDLLRPRIRTLVHRWRKLRPRTPLEEAFEAYTGQFSGCRSPDDYIGVLTGLYAAPAAPTFVSHLKLSSGRPRPAVR